MGALTTIRPTRDGFQATRSSYGVTVATTTAATIDALQTQPQR